MRLRRLRPLSAALLLAALAATAGAQAQETKGSVLDPTAANLALTLAKAQVVLPAGAAGPGTWRGLYAALPPVAGRWPVAVVMHGSSGIAAFIIDYQTWLAEELGIASIAPDSLAIPDRLTYKSPVAVAIYERVHALRAAELAHAGEAVRVLAWADPRRLVQIGTSEGSVPVARSADPQTAARVLYAWSCERNYFVDQPRTAIPAEVPVLNAIASSDPFFAPGNAWNKDYAVQGNCAAALRDHKTAAVYIPVSDKHTIINADDVRAVTAQFLRRALDLRR